MLMTGHYPVQKLNLIKSGYGKAVPYSLFCVFKKIVESSCLYNLLTVYFQTECNTELLSSFAAKNHSV